MNIQFHPAADQELAQASEWYGNWQPGLGIELEQDVYAALDLIADAPRAWRPWPGLSDVWVFTMNRFPFLIPYMLDRQRIIVLAIAHAKRRPGYWRERVRDG